MNNQVQMDLISPECCLIMDNFKNSKNMLKTKKTVICINDEPNSVNQKEISLKLYNITNLEKIMGQLSEYFVSNHKLKKG